MKILGIVGSNASFSYNRLLLEDIGRRFGQLFELEIIDTKGVPLFSQNKSLSDYPLIQAINDKIDQADGVIIATPEHNHSLPSSLKSLLEWLSFQLHPFEKKPVMVMGTSYYLQGTSRAQVHLRQILNAPGVNAWVLPGNEFLLNNAKAAFDEKNQLKDPGTLAFLETCLQQFVNYLTITQGLAARVPQSSAQTADTTSGASESWNQAPAPVVSRPSLDQTPFDQALDKAFGGPLAHAAKDPFDQVLDRIYPPATQQTPFEKALDETFGADLGLAGKDSIAEALR